MGFQTADQLGRFPAHAHRLSPVLTLQARWCPLRHAD
jgi:hypothetical protein